MEICFTTLPTTYVEDNSAPKRARPAFFHLLLILVSPFSPTSMGRLYGKVLGSVSQSAVVARYIWEGGPRKWAAKEEKRSQAGFLPGDGVPLLWNSLCEMERKEKEEGEEEEKGRPPARFL